MRVFFTPRFERAHDKLSDAEKDSVEEAILRLRLDPRHPGLQVKKMEGHDDIWEARCSRRLRMTFQMTGGSAIMRNVGEHDKVLKNP